MCKKTMGVSLILSALLVITGAVVKIDKLWSVIDVLVIISCLTNGIILLKNSNDTGGNCK